MNIRDQSRIVPRMTPLVAAGILIGCSTAQAPSGPQRIDHGAWTETQRFELPNQIKTFALARSGRFAVIVERYDNPHTITVLRPRDKSRTTLTVASPADSTIHSVPEAVAVSPDGTQIAVGWTGDLHLVRAEDGSQIHTTYLSRDDLGRRGAFTDLVYTPDGSGLFGAVTRIGWWDAGSGELLGVFGGINAIRLAAIDSTTVAATTAVAVHLSDLDRGARGLFCTFGGRANAIVSDPNGELIAASLSRGSQIRVYRIEDCEVVSRWATGANYIRSLIWTPDGRHIMASTGDGRVLIFEVEGEVLVHTLQLHDSTFGLALSADGRTMMTVDTDVVTFWELP